MAKKHWHKDPGLWINAVALAVSVFALGFACRANSLAAEATRQVRVLATPSLTFAEQYSSGRLNAVTLRSTGPAPAYVKDLVIFVDESPIGDKLDERAWSTVLAMTEIPDSELVHGWVAAGDALPTGETVTLLAADSEAASSTDRSERLNTALKRIGFAVCYCSVFDDCTSQLWGRHGAIGSVCTPAGFRGAR